MSVNAASALPLSHEGSEMDPPFTVGGRATPAPGDEPTAPVTFVTPGYFQTIGMRLVSGRLFTDQDSPASPPVAVVVAFVGVGRTNRSVFGPLKWADFIQFYTLGDIARTRSAPVLFDFEARQVRQTALVPESADDRFIPVYGPRAALI